MKILRIYGGLLFLMLALTGCGPGRESASGPEADDVYATRAELEAEDEAARAQAKGSRPERRPRNLPAGEDRTAETDPPEEDYRYRNERDEQQRRQRQRRGVSSNAFSWIAAVVIELAIDVAIFWLIYR